PLVWQIDPIDLSDEDFDTAEQLAERIDNVRDLQIAGSDFVQHRREQEKIIPTDQANLHLGRARQQSLQVQRRIDAPKTSAEDDDLLFRRLAGRAVVHGAFHGVVSAFDIFHSSFNVRMKATSARVSLSLSLALNFGISPLIPFWMIVTMRWSDFVTPCKSGPSSPRASVP